MILKYFLVSAVLLLGVYGVDRGTIIEISDVNECSLGPAAQANRRFSYALFRIAANKQSKKNIFLSPIVVGKALSMVQAGSQGATKQQIYRAMKLDKTKDFTDNDIPCLLQMYSNKLVEEKQQQKEDAYKTKLSKKFEPLVLQTAGRLFGSTTYPFNSTFMQTTSNYGAEMEMLNFTSEPEQSREKINRWVAGQTRNKIPELFGRDTIGSNTALAIVSAIYFKGFWKIPFKEELTIEGQFNVDKDTEATVKYMRKNDLFRYHYSSVLQADMAELPYEPDANGIYNASMILIVPSGESIDTLVKSMSENNLTGSYGAITKLLESEPRRTQIVLPKFRMEAEYDLKPLLRGLGIKHLFNGNKADLGGMLSSNYKGPNIYVNKAVHKTFIEVNEEGTEAAGAAGVGIIPLSLPPSVYCNKPFIVIIYEKNTGGVLFIGRINNPAE